MLSSNRVRTTYQGVAANVGESEMLIITNDATRKVKKKSLVVWCLILLMLGLSPMALLNAVIFDMR